MEKLDSAFQVAGPALNESMGTLRLTVPPSAIFVVIKPVLKAFLLANPDIKIDLMVDNSLVDIVSKGYDAGICYDHVLAQDMAAIPLMTDMRFCVVASPDFIKAKPRSRPPRDLLKHDCINYRSADTDALYRWELIKSGVPLCLSVAGRMSTNDSGVILQSALDGFGFAYVLHQAAQPHLDSGELISVLEGWSAPATLYLYHFYPSGMPRKLRVFIDFMKSCRE